MKSLAATGLIALLAISLTSCITSGMHSRNQAATSKWLAESAGKPTINVTGNWYGDGWGHGYFKQTGNRVTGHIAEYPVTGVVNGDTLYLAVTEDGFTENTIVAKAEGPGVLVGGYSDWVPFVEKGQKSIRLVRSAR
jgi:hypothetical protein